MHYTHQSSPLVCARKIDIDIDDSSGTISNVTFTGGCPGNLIAVGILVKGKKPEEVIAKLEGINCGGKGTSCADQLAKALRTITGNK